MAAVLGRAPETGPPEDLSNAYERLASPLEHLVVGKGAEGWGYEEMSALLHAKRYDLLKQVLRGPNPEGRAYAALALQAAGALDASDRHAINVLRRASPGIVADVELRDDMGFVDPADRFFSRLRWPRPADMGP
jgi:hypothetical protein